MTFSNRMKKYLLQATRGLPSSERPLIMAEMKGHLLDRIEQYQQEGFTRAEAESMALERFGSQHGLALKLSFAHWTLPAGWTTLGVTLALLGGTVWNIARAQTPQKTAQALQSVPAQGTLGEAKKGLKIQYHLAEGRTLDQSLSAQGVVQYRVFNQAAADCPSGQQTVLDLQWSDGHYQLAECQTGAGQLQQSGSTITWSNNQTELQVRTE
ncbi:permease prefix domain 1-containing protein [Deinococcus cellulosilyticus]|uniref:Uncharacterized protein n=1 Tax=Deinococcus cellulosilyticus (strain DSM 18568 / NBRC 106333 / KACC 11606 / 5516J-15) TaxID=1223518 RepID=A0A511N0B8_DEIC1|nr:permease prefix domain 1-containing protein [Deinococcus cellulosilyticus]GEM45826.1 hypothetical protein DC3_14610 [Deinococcus cellulosilyticus NBRC 106333 = KACC 11606]